MRTIWLIATTEFLLIVRTKAFLFGLFLLPMVTVAVVFLGARLAAKSQLPVTPDASKTEVLPFRLMVIDRSGALSEPLQQRANEYNSRGILFKDPPLDLQVVLSPEKSDELLQRELGSKLSDKLDAFVIIPPNISESPTLNWITRTPDSRFVSWFYAALNDIVREQKLERAGLSASQRSDLRRTVDVLSMSLEPAPAETKTTSAAVNPMERLLNFFIPSGMVFLLFVLVMMSIQPLLTTALEEKMSRISEILLGMVDPFTLMMGKLIGSLGASFLVALFYAGTGLLMLYLRGYLLFVPMSAFGYLLLFLFPALFFFGSLYLAVGAACSDVKDAQALLTPFMLVMMMPLFVLPFLLREPDGTLSVALSFFPASAPFVMLMRASINPGPPVWQLLLSIVVTFGATALFVVAAGRVFRSGLLMQGKPPSLREFIRWSLQ